MDLLIRDATEADLPAIVDIYNQSIPAGWSTADTEPIAVVDRLGWFRRFDPARRPIVLDTRGGYKDYFRGHLPTAHHLNFDTLRGTDNGVPVQYLPDDLTNEEAIGQLKQRRHRRVPVYAETPDQVVGVLDVKRFLLDPGDHYTETLVAPSFVPETMKAMDLLRNFLSHSQGLAIVSEGPVVSNTVWQLAADFCGEFHPLARLRHTRRR